MVLLTENPPGVCLAKGPSAAKFTLGTEGKVVLSLGKDLLVVVSFSD